MKGDHLRYWCHRCMRALVNDPSLSYRRGAEPPRDHGDTVTYLNDLHHLRHDGCGGIVAHSKREAEIA